MLLGQLQHGEKAPNLIALQLPPNGTLVARTLSQISQLRSVMRRKLGIGILAPQIVGFLIG